MIANKNPELPINGFEFITWTQSSEVSDLQKFDIGIMPLTDDIWSKGKCGFKAIQYGASGIPALVSPVGVNTEVVKDELTGFLCNNTEDWKTRLEELILDESKRQKMGAAGRKHIEANYSVNAIRDKFLSLFES